MLVEIEGIDGAGKGTLSRGLVALAEQVGLKAAYLSFPRYDETKFGVLAGQYLDGRFGGIDEVPVRFASLLYAGDRYESKAHLQSLMAENDLVILDRYVASNAAYNGAKLQGEERREMVDWIFETEFDLFQLPLPDMTLLVQTRPEVANELILRKEKRSYTEESHDIHEAARDYMDEVAALYQSFAEENRRMPWYAVEPMGPGGELRAPEDICADAWRIISEQMKPA